MKISFYTFNSTSFEAESKVVKEEDEKHLQIEIPAQDPNSPFEITIQQNMINSVTVMSRTRIQNSLSTPFTIHYIQLRSNYKSTQIISGEADRSLNVFDGIDKIRIGESDGITYFLSGQNLYFFMPVKHKLLRKGGDTRRYVTRNNNVQSFDMGMFKDTQDPAYRFAWVIFDTGTTNAFLVASIDPAGGVNKKMVLRRVVFKPFTSTCTLTKAELQVHAVSIDAFYGDTSHARYGLKNSFSFIFLTGIKEDFSVALRKQVLIIIFVSIAVVIILATIVVVKASASTTALMKMAIETVTKESENVKRSGNVSNEAERQNLV